MKDEEMAEEWWNNWLVKDWNDLQKAKKLFIQAFLAGLKAGRPQWHKDKYSHSEKDKLLPCGKVKGYYRVILYDNYKEPQIIRPETEIEFVGNQREHIIAWCEIPTFDKE